MVLTKSVFIPLNVPPMSRKAGAFSKVSANAAVQVSGLGEEKPLVKIGDSAYEGEWTDLVGSEMYFNNATGAYVGKSRERIMLRPMRLHHKEEDVEAIEPKKRPHILDQIRIMNSEMAKSSSGNSTSEAATQMDVAEVAAAAAAVTAATIQDPASSASLDVTMEDA